jgi:exo-1,4-beta-D-glucosaminidase
MSRSIRRSVTSGVTAILATAALLYAASTAPAEATPAHAGPAGNASPAGNISTVSPPPGTGATDVSDLGARGWAVQSSAAATQTGAQISTPGFDTSSWLRVANDDAGAPGTEIEALAQNGRCPGDPTLEPVNQGTSGTHSVFYAGNIKTCYGFMSSVGADTVPEFDVPWWWRTDFTPGNKPGQAATLILNGVIGDATVWVNGHEIATATGAYTRSRFDITKLIQPGINSLAIEISPNNPNKMFTLDDVDWNQIPPDNNTGIQFPVQLAVDGPLSDGNARVVQATEADLSSSALTVKADITNNASISQTGQVTAIITPPGRGLPVTVSQDVTVPADATQTVTFTPDRYPGLTIRHPRIWWPYQMGSQPLYTLTTEVSQHGTALNRTTETFGIRTVTSYLTKGTSKGAPSGARAFKINGVPVVIRGGGFSPNLFLHYDTADIARQIALMKTMGLNTIRLEGHIMPPDFFQQMDRAGILINAGYQCCDAWELQGSGLTSAADYRIMQNSALAIGQNLRNHPSVFSFQWSDQPPLAEQEKVTLSAFAQADFDDPVISSAEYQSSPRLGASGEKEGPYNWVPPDYWYDTTHVDTDDSSQTNAGGSWGFDSEQSAGDTVPTLDSLNRFLSPGDEAALWQSPAANQYHLNYEPRCSVGYSFGTLCKFDAALDARYGTPASVNSYVEEAQAQDYENTRAQFEAFLDHSTNSPVPSTGTIYWQMNKGWPSLLWTLYGSDGDQAGSYFGAQEANRSLHALYALDNGTVTLDNLSGTPRSGLSVESRVYRIDGTLLDDQTAGNLTLASQGVRNNVLTPKVPGGSPAQVYFVELLLRQHGALADRNVYWLSTQPDVVNWAKTLGEPSGIISQYANLQALQKLPPSSVTATAVTTRQDGADLTTAVTITDTSSSAVSFLLRADVRRGTATGQELAGDNELQSSTWQGNDVTLFPGESQTLVVRYRLADLRGASPVISVSGWNVPKIDIKALFIPNEPWFPPSVTPCHPPLPERSVIDTYSDYTAGGLWQTTTASAARPSTHSISRPDPRRPACSPSAWPPAGRTPTWRSTTSTAALPGTHARNWPARTSSATSIPRTNHPSRPCSSRPFPARPAISRPGHAWSASAATWSGRAWPDRSSSCRRASPAWRHSWRTPPRPGSRRPRCAAWSMSCSGCAAWTACGSSSTGSRMTSTTCSP